MAPQGTRKRKSEVIQDAVSTPPTDGPSAKKLRITQAQKQALIDNLQLEITERARHLRAHYALQSTDLRSRVERRINRIPISLRKANMGDLLVKSTEKVAAKANSAVPTRPVVPAAVEHRALTTSKQLNPSKAIAKARSRSSPELAIHSDKENAPSPRPVGLNNPKNPKRTGLGTKRAVSRAKNSGTVLSPKSHNSRTLPRSPIKDSHSSDTENHVANAPPTPSPIRITKLSTTYRPTSPLKPPSPMKLKSAASAAASSISASLSHLADTAKRTAAASATGSLRRTASKDKAAKPVPNKSTINKMGPPPRPAANDRPSSQVSNHSATSTMSSATTVVTKKGTVAAAGTVRGKAGVKASAGKASALKATTAATASSRVGTGLSAVGKKVVLAEPAAGRRVLRTRA